MTVRDPFADGIKDPFADPFIAPAPQAHQRPRGEGRISGEIGIWVFIFGDLLLFGLFFGIFVYERSLEEEVFEQSRQTMSLTIGAVNTLLLLTGSMLVVLGLNALRRGAARQGTWMILLALVCAAGFVFDKYLEYSAKLAEDHTPFTNAFYMYYFVFTGIHLFHLLVGMVALVIMCVIARKQTPGTPPTVRDLRLLEAAACYWHLIDLLWIVLFALIYLMR